MGVRAMSKGNGIELLKKNHLELGRKYQKSMERNKELLTQNDILEAEKADIVKAYNELHSACHHSAGEFKYLNKSVEELINLNDEKAKKIRQVKNLNNVYAIALSIAAIVMVCLIGGK